MTDKAVLSVQTAPGKEKDFTVQYNPASLKAGDEGTLSFTLVIEKDDKVDVFDTVCGFLGIFTGRVFRRASLSWEKMCFQGEITQISAGFERFDKEGAPLRGRIDMTLKQTGGFGEQETYWSRAHEQIP